MGKKESKRNYNMSDGRLVIECRSKLTSARRDKTEFEQRNIKEATHYAPFETQINAFSDLPTDVEEGGIKQEATEEKNRIGQTL